MQYTVIRKDKRKTASVSVAPDNSVSIIAPQELSEDEIAKIVKRKHQWILNKKALNNEVRKPGKPKEYVSGEAFSYLGRNYRLKVIRGNSESIQCRNGRFCVEVSKNADSALIRNLLIDWYKTHALAKFKQRARRYADLLDVTPKSLKTGDFKRQWGSCYQDQTVILNWRVIMAPISIVDYVVAHELCHLIHHDHSREFWNLLQKIMPDYQQRKDYLRINGPYLEI